MGCNISVGLCIRYDPRAARAARAARGTVGARGALELTHSPKKSWMRDQGVSSIR